MESDSEEEKEKESKDDEEESEQEDAGDLDVVLEKLLEICKACHLTTKTYIIAAQQKQKRQYDNKHNSLKVCIICYSIVNIFIEG